MRVSAYFVILQVLAHTEFFHVLKLFFLLDTGLTPPPLGIVMVLALISVFFPDCIYNTVLADPLDLVLLTVLLIHFPEVVSTDSLDFVFLTALLIHFPEAVSTDLLDFVLLTVLLIHFPEAVSTDLLNHVLLMVLLQLPLFFPVGIYNMVPAHSLHLVLLTVLPLLLVFLSDLLLLLAVSQLFSLVGNYKAVLVYSMHLVHLTVLLLLSLFFLVGIHKLLTIDSMHLLLTDLVPVDMHILISAVSFVLVLLVPGLCNYDNLVQREVPCHYF